MSTFVAIVTCLMLVLGWRLRDVRLITPASGVGYVLGIVGTALILILLLYSLRKRTPQLRHAGPMKIWFQWHMLLGILGPVMILFHANFRLGALNSNVALFSMLVVVTSGVIGRYLYNLIHHRLDGHRLSLVELRQELEQQQHETGPLLALIPGLREELFGFADRVLAPSPTVPGSLARALDTGRRALSKGWASRRLAFAYVSRHADAHHWSAARQRTIGCALHRDIRRVLAKTVRVAEFSFYERLFALWHALHVPLVALIVVTVTIHVIAVHLF